jgi:hypothetical protein
MYYIVIRRFSQTVVRGNRLSFYGDIFIAFGASIVIMQAIPTALVFCSLSGKMQIALPGRGCPRGSRTALIEAKHLIKAYQRMGHVQVYGKVPALSALTPKEKDQ